MTSVKENLLQMKNLTELMIDLAYSALFLSNRALAKEVLELHKRIELLEKESLKHIFKVRGRDEEMIRLIDLMEYIKDISNAAVDLAVLAKEDKISPIIKDIFGEAEERIIAGTVAKNSAVAGRELGDSKVRSISGVNIVAVKRRGDWVFGVNRRTVLKQGDFVVGIGQEDGLFKFKGLLSRKAKKS